MEEKSDKEIQEATPGPLQDQVALVFAGANAGARSLALSLARYGADIAIVYDLENAAQMRETKRAVEAEGRRCLIIPAREKGAGFSRGVVMQTMNALGSLDIFIDYSAPGSDASDLGTGIQKLADVETYDSFSPIENIEFLSAVLHQMTEADEVTAPVNRPINESKNGPLRVAQELTNNPVISAKDGRMLGKVRDIYLDRQLRHPVAISLGRDGLLDRTETLILWSAVIAPGPDAVLVEDAGCLLGAAETEGYQEFIRRDDLDGRPVNTPGGTKIGRIGDVILDQQAGITGFTLSHTYVSGPIAANKAISRSSVIDPGSKNNPMMANLAEAEVAGLQVVRRGFFAEPKVTPAQSARTAEIEQEE